MNLNLIHDAIDETVSPLGTRDITSLVRDYSEWFFKLVEKRKSDPSVAEMTKQIDRIATCCGSPCSAKSAITALMEEATGKKLTKAGKPLSFRDGSIINYQGETIMTWLGDKGVDSLGHDLLSLSRDANYYDIPSTSEMRHFVKEFFTGDQRAYSRLMKWVAKTYFNK